eukprot:gene21698-53536_t
MFQLELDSSSRASWWAARAPFGDSGIAAASRQRTPRPSRGREGD